MNMTPGKWISLPSAIIVLFAFFMPWVTVSCNGQIVESATGYSISTGANQANWWFALIPAAAVIALVLIALSLYNQIPERVAGIGLVVAVLMAGIAFFVRWQQIRSELDTALDTAGYEISYEWGLYATAAGLAGILIGGILSALQSADNDYFPETAFGGGTTQTMAAPPIPQAPFAPPPPVVPPPAPELPPTQFVQGGGFDRMGGMAGGESGAPVAPSSPKTEILFQKPVALAWLVMTEGTRVGHQFRLHENNGIGRSADNDIVLDDGALSSQHARVRLEEGAFWLYDLASTNGTFLYDKESRDWKQIYREKVEDGSRIKLGRTVLQFMQIKTEPETA